MRCVVDLGPRTMRTTSTTSIQRRRRKQSAVDGAWGVTSCGAPDGVWRRGEKRLRKCLQFRTSTVAMSVITTRACTLLAAVSWLRSGAFSLTGCGGSGCALIVNPPGHRALVLAGSGLVPRLYQPIPYPLRSLCWLRLESQAQA